MHMKTERKERKRRDQPVSASLVEPGFVLWSTRYCLPGVCPLRPAARAGGLGQARCDWDSDPFLWELASLCLYIVAAVLPQAALSTADVCKRVTHRATHSVLVFSA